LKIKKPKNPKNVTFYVFLNTFHDVQSFWLFWPEKRKLSLMLMKQEWS